MRYIFRFFLRIIDVIVFTLGGPSMLKFIFRRILAAVPVLFAIAVVSFGLSHSLPGGPFDATTEQRRVPDHVRLQLEQRYGLNKRLFFDTPTDTKGAETTWGQQAFVKGGYGSQSQVEGVLPEIDANTGIALYQQYDLFQWDDATQSYIAYEKYPYQDWAQQNKELIYTVDTLSSLTSSLGGVPSVSMVVSSEWVGNSISSNYQVNQLNTLLEDCQLYRQTPGWSVVARRTECVTLGGDVSGSIMNEAQQVWRIDALDSQFWNYLWNVVNLDFGPSLNIAQLQENRQVSDEISRRMPVSMEVGFASVIFGFSVGIPLGVLAAVYHNTVVDAAATFSAVMGQSISIIALAPLLVIIFTVELNILPTPQRDAWDIWGDEKTLSFFSRKHLSALILPMVAGGIGMSAGIARLTRASLLQVLNEDYIRTARAKGLHERTVVYIHGLKNSLIPIATILGPLFAGVMMGGLVTELIFLIPGLGSSFTDSVHARDYTTLMAITLIYSTLLIAGNIFVDIMYTWLDPRIRFD